MRFLLGIDSHLGDRVSALVDGQLSSSEEERAWNHVLTCPGCRRLVERERWMKSRLSAFAAVPSGDPTPRPGLMGALYDVDAWAEVDAIERQGVRRRAATAAVGAGTVGAAVIGMVMFTGAPAGMGERPSRAPAQISTGLPGTAGSPAPQQGPTFGPVSSMTRHRAR